MLPALISAIAAIWRKVVAEYPWRRNSFAAASKTESRDFSDFEIWAISPACVLVLAGGSCRFNPGVRGTEARLALDRVRRWSPLTNKDLRVGIMFKAPSAVDYWRSHMASSTAGHFAQTSIRMKAVRFHQMSCRDASFFVLIGALVAQGAPNMVSEMHAGAGKMGLAKRQPEFALFSVRLRSRRDRFATAGSAFARPTAADRGAAQINLSQAAEW